MHVTIIGPGRLGRSLAILFRAGGNTVSLVGRDQSEPSSDVRVLTVPDACLEAVATLAPKDRPTLHCSGATPDSVLGEHHPMGRLHPLMTFPGPDIAMPNIRPIPAAISGDREGREIAWTLAESAGFMPFNAPDNVAAYHAAAVIAGNFATILLEEAAAVLVRTGMAPDHARKVLAPLAQQSIHNAAHTDKFSLTGPITRGDEDVIQAHRTALSDLDMKKTLCMYEVMIERAKDLIKDQS